MNNNPPIKKGIKIDCGPPSSRPTKAAETPTTRSNLANGEKGEVLGPNRAVGRPDDEIKKYVREYSEVSQFLDTMTDPKILRNVEEAKGKEYLNRVIVLAQDWKIVSEDIQNQLKREDLVSKLTPLLQHENINVKFRVIRACLFVMRNVGFAEYITNSVTSQSSLDPEASFATTTEREDGDSSNELPVVIKSLAKLSKEATNDTYFLQEGLFAFVVEILAIIPSLKQDPQINLLSLLLNTLKNITGNEEIRKRALENKNCSVLSNLLAYLNEWARVNKKKAKDIYKILYALTALLRNLAVDPSCTIIYYETGVITGLCDVIDQNLQEADLVLNCLRILSKLSLNRDCCFKIGEDERNVSNLIQILKIHRNGLFIVIRAAFILANMTTYIERTREYLYFERKIFPQLMDCFCFYVKKGNEKGPDMDKVFRTSFAKFDKAAANEKDQDALTKLVRLMANLFTLDKIGTDFVTKEVAQYKFLLRHVCAIIKDKDVGANTEILIAGLSFLANIMFFEKQALNQEDFELRTIRTEILFTLSRFVIQTNNEEICLEALRVLSNLSRDKALAKQITKTKLVEAVIELLKHNNKDIVYYALGIVMNLMLTEDMKKADIQQNILTNVVNILFYSTIEEFDIVACCLKCATNVLDSLQSSNVDGNTLKTLEELIVNFGEQCDVIMSKNPKDESGDVKDLRGIINHLLNIMPEEGFMCPHSNCGRKFKSEKELKNHVTRRHNN